MFDLDAYLERIGLDGRPSVHEVHRAHSTSIPFENLDPYCGLPVSLAIEDLERKLVTERRGGYCFEQNLLLKAGLEALGAQVEILLARVRFRAPAGAIRPRSHLVLRVTTDEIWHADVGFGQSCMLDPLPFGPGTVHEQSGWQFRIVQDGSELVFQSKGAGDWKELYGFIPEQVPLIDAETSSWFTSTNPRSPFVTGLTVSMLSDDGGYILLEHRGAVSLAEGSASGETVTPLSTDDLPQLLADRFGLTGHSLSEEGQLLTDRTLEPA